jgi:Ca2+-binding EF-hand superfamily protein
MDAADALLGQMGQGAQDPAAPPAAIKIAEVTDDQLTQLGVTRDDLNAWDANQDGALTRPELVEGLRALTLQQAPPTPGAQDYARAMLANFDTDESGALGLDEFGQAVAGSSMDASAVQDSFDAWDANHYGAIDAATTFALTALDLPLAQTFAGVVVWRAFSFWLPTIPALIALARVRGLGRVMSTYAGGDDAPTGPVTAA